jgi:hypothetical protein
MHTIAKLFVYILGYISEELTSDQHSNYKELRRKAFSSIWRFLVSLNSLSQISILKLALSKDPRPALKSISKSELFDLPLT